MARKTAPTQQRRYRSKNSELLATARMCLGYERIGESRSNFNLSRLVSSATDSHEDLLGGKAQTVQRIRGKASRYLERVDRCRITEHLKRNGDRFLGRRIIRKCHCPGPCDATKDVSLLCHRRS